jgi:hypothetical protein
MAVFPEIDMIYKPLRFCVPRLKLKRTKRLRSHVFSCGYYLGYAEFGRSIRGMKVSCLKQKRLPTLVVSVLREGIAQRLEVLGNRSGNRTRCRACYPVLHPIRFKDVLKHVTQGKARVQDSLDVLFVFHSTKRPPFIRRVENPSLFDLCLWRAFRKSFC